MTARTIVIWNCFSLLIQIGVQVLKCLRNENKRVLRVLEFLSRNEGG